MHMKTIDFDYILPENRIAQSRIHPYDHAKLLHYNRKTKTTSDNHFYEILSMLTDNDVLVFNNTMVFKARLLGKKLTGGNVEVLLLDPPKNGILTYRCLIKGHVQKNMIIAFEGFRGCIIELLDDTTRIISFSLPLDSVHSQIENAAHFPLPHYISSLEGKDDYQTVYANNEKQDSIAAPTAGFHFTQELLNKIKQKGVACTTIALAIGIGTFRPVKTELIEDHPMHYESYSIDKSTKELLNNYKKQGKRIIAIGTTCVRTLEDSADKNGVLEKENSKTNIFIYPPYTFKFVDAMITNFHLPQSTLLMLVSAFMGINEAKHAYQHALEQDYRFYSFGDAMFID